MDDKRKTWRSTVWKILAVLALLLLYAGVNNTVAGKIPPPGPERHGWMVGAFGIPAVLICVATVLFVSEKSK